MALVYLGLGSNVGDRAAFIERAAAALATQPHTTVHRRSSVHEYAAVGGPPQAPFLNAVVEITTSLPPRDLLDGLREIEAALGRARPDAVRWGPRTIDLDLLLYDHLVLDEDGLTIPHPRLAERRFVLEPLVELAPEVRHPILNLTARELLRRL